MRVEDLRGVGWYGWAAQEGEQPWQVSADGWFERTNQEGNNTYTQTGMQIEQLLPQPLFSTLQLFPPDIKLGFQGSKSWGEVALILQANPERIWQRDDDGDTVLMYAADMQHTSTVLLCILLAGQRANELVAMCNDDGDTSLHLAAKGMSPRLMKALLLVADSRLESAQNSDGETALDIAQESPEEAIVNLLSNPTARHECASGTEWTVPCEAAWTDSAYSMAIK